MKYPDHTESKPVTGAQAERVLNAINSGTTITNDRYEATIDRILAARDRAASQQRENGGTDTQVQRS